jgi:ketosteroid isomerase-like protein
MSQSNVEIVRLAHEAFNRNDFEAARRLVHPDAEWRNRSFFLGSEDVYRGHAGLQKWWTNAKEPWDYFTSHIERIFEEDGRLVTVVRLEGVGVTSGAEVELPSAANVWELEGGLVKRFSAYGSLEEALEAEGLKG